MCRDTFLTERIFRPVPEKRAFRPADEICAPHPTTRALWGSAQNNLPPAKKETPPDWMVYLFLAGVQGFVLDFCSTFRICFYVMFRKNLRSPFKNSALCCFFTAFESQLYTHNKKQRIPFGMLCFLAGVQGFEPR